MPDIVKPVQRRRRDRLQSAFDHLRDVQKTEPAGQETFDRDLIGRIQHSWGRTAGLQGLPGQAQGRKAYAVGRFEAKLADRGQVEPGDGRGALVAGGVGAALVKTGLLQKFWKLIVIALIAIGAALKKLLAGIFGGKEQTEVSDLPPQG